jgi:hypothetical protein
MTMATSSNGWTASPTLSTRPLTVGGVSFVPGVRDDDDVAYVLDYVMTQFHERVEPLVNPGCWGFSFRPNRNDPNALSNHASGTAVDANAPQHPNGVAASSTFTAAQIGTIHLILAEVHDAIRWGGDFHTTPDAMHFEVNTTPANLAAVARQLRNEQEAKMPLNSEDLAAVRSVVKDEITNAMKTAGEVIKLDVGDDAKWSLERVLKFLKVRT